MAEWQTRRSQKPLSASSCGFDSHCWHQLLQVNAAAHQRSRRRLSARLGFWINLRSRTPPSVERPSLFSSYRILTRTRTTAIKAKPTAN